MKKSRLAVLLGCAILIPILVAAQTKAAPTTVAPQAPAAKVDESFVRQAFGKEFNFIASVGSTTGDLDGDGVEDIVIAARCKNPLLDQAEHNYVVIDPYNTFYGYGDPKVTMSFGDDNPLRRGLVVLVIHGAGAEAWRSTAPKAKFVVINQPYRSLSVRQMRTGKKPLQAIYVEEGNDFGETSALYFDGKKYKYVPMGQSMQ